MACIFFSVASFSRRGVKRLGPGVFLALNLSSALITTLLNYDILQHCGKFQPQFLCFIIFKQYTPVNARQRLLKFLIIVFIIQENFLCTYIFLKTSKLILKDFVVITVIEYRPDITDIHKVFVGSKDKVKYVIPSRGLVDMLTQVPFL